MKYLENGCNIIKYMFYLKCMLFRMGNAYCLQIGMNVLNKIIQITLRSYIEMRFINRFSLTCLGLIYSASSFAGGGGTLVYAPILDPAATAAAPIPTLSETMLIVLSLLLVAIVFRINQKSNSNTLMLVLMGALGTGAILSATGGLKIITDVNADGGNSGGIVIPLQSRNGGQVPIAEGQLSIFENTSGRDQRVTEINRPSNRTNADVGLIQGVSRCNVGTVVLTTIQGVCYIDCRQVLTQE